MAVLFKIIVALFALIAIVSAVQPAEGNARPTHGPYKAVMKDSSAGGSSNGKDIPSSLESAHSRHKRGCKTVTYKKGGRTITAQKC